MINSKLLKINCDGLFEEVHQIDFDGKYIADEKGFPIVINNKGNFVSLEDYDIIKNELIVYSYGGGDWEYKQEVLFSTIYNNGRGNKSLRFILED